MAAAGQTQDRGQEMPSRCLQSSRNYATDHRTAENYKQNKRGTLCKESSAGDLYGDVATLCLTHYQGLEDGCMKAESLYENISWSFLT